MIRHLFRIIGARRIRNRFFREAAHKARFWWDIESGMGVTVYDANGGEVLSWSQYSRLSAVRGYLACVYKENEEGFEDLRGAVLLASVDAISECRHTDEVLGIYRVIAMVVEPLELE